MAREVVRGWVLRGRGARPAVTLRVGRRPARPEFRQLRALARLPRPHAGGRRTRCNKQTLSEHPFEWTLLAAAVK